MKFVLLHFYVLLVLQTGSRAVWIAFLKVWKYMCCFVINNILKCLNNPMIVWNIETWKMLNRRLCFFNCWYFEFVMWLWKLSVVVFVCLFDFVQNVVVVVLVEVWLVGLLFVWKSEMMISWWCEHLKVCVFEILVVLLLLCVTKENRLYELCVIIVLLLLLQFFYSKQWYYEIWKNNICFIISWIGDWCWTVVVFLNCLYIYIVFETSIMFIAFFDATLNIYQVDLLFLLFEMCVWCLFVFCYKHIEPLNVVAGHL